ncbi:GGDEF domain-containing protein [Streptomyces sp. NPDC002602]|uniref:GGDEF domain-containing protein n=1 Tax=Streptomyces sp. NPDC002602 TaxID=3364654 RepID=UPI00368A7BDB
MTELLVRENHFKQINDGMGHTAGDAVLASISARLTAWAGPRAAIGRLGGDEFAVVLQLTAGRRAQRLEQLVRMLHTPVTLDDGRRAGLPGTSPVGAGRMSALTLSEGDWIPGITVRQPWAACILVGKSPENSPHPCSRRDWVLLHAGKARPDPAVLRELLLECESLLPVSRQRDQRWLPRAGERDRSPGRRPVVEVQ